MNINLALSTLSTVSLNVYGPGILRKTRTSETDECPLSRSLPSGKAARGLSTRHVPLWCLRPSAHSSSPLTFTTLEGKLYCAHFTEEEIGDQRNQKNEIIPVKAPDLANAWCMVSAWQFLVLWFLPPSHPTSFLSPARARVWLPGSCFSYLPFWDKRECRIYLGSGANKLSDN